MKVPPWTFRDTLRHLSRQHLTDEDVNALVQNFAARAEELRSEVQAASKRYEDFVIQICAEQVRRRTTSPRSGGG